MPGEDGVAVEIRPLAPADPAVRRLIGELDRLQTSLYPAESNHLDPIEVLEGSDVTFLAAFVGGEAVGCGAVKRMPGGYGEIKRVFVDPAARRRGVGRAMMEALETDLLTHGIDLARLETGVRQPEALALYEHSGYVRIPPFGDYREDPLSVFLEKRLV
ncbi:MAG: GNAT family N-acetyltransferase [Deltaproteobacteria bacterium]|nr:GNAT family N-acetyltransferase [Deltaproteobacteria bacterium]